jgi:adenylate cyclase
MSFFAELKRRNVIRVGAAYVVLAWLVIQVAETIFPLFGYGDAPARIVVVVLAIAFIPALTFAWAFELTPEGLKKESEVDRSQSVTPQTGKKLDRVIMVMLALGLAYFAFDKFVLHPQREAAKDEQFAGQVERAKQQGRTEALVESYGDQSIAVLAFDDMSQAGDQEYLSDGIAEELLNLLAKIPELRVISRSSAFSFKGKDLPLTEIAQQLNVAHILEGSVRKAGNRVRITAQLIEARSDTHLWSETYDRQLDDIFAIQDEIAVVVVEQLKLTLLGAAPHVQEVDPDAYALVLQARHLGRLGSAESYEHSNELYAQALAIEPDYAAAWDGLAVNYRSQANFGLRTSEEAYALVLEAAHKALAIDPGYAPAHGRLGWRAMIYENDLAAAARHFERALELSPDDLGIISDAAVLLFILGRIDETITLEEYVVARDPLNSTSHYNLAASYHVSGRSDEAIVSYRTALRLSPDRIAARYYLGLALLIKGEAEAALDEMQQEKEPSSRRHGLALAYHALGQPEMADAALAELIEQHGREAASRIASVLAYRNEADRAFEWLDKAVEYGETGLTEITLDHLFSSIHEDPRWRPLVERIGSSPEQLDAIKFDVTLPAQ